MSVASAKPVGASSSRRSPSKCMVLTMPVKAGSSTSSVSTWSKHGLLVFLQIASVGGGQALQGGQQAGQIADESAGLGRGLSSAISGFFFCGMMEEPVE